MHQSLSRFGPRADVNLAALLRQLLLLLPLAVPRALFFAALVNAMRAADAGNEVFGGLLFLAHRASASAAHAVIALFQPVAHGHALIEDEAFAVPQALVLWYGLKVFQDAAFQVEDVLDPFLAQEAG